MNTQAFCRIVTWSVSVMFGSTGIVAAWAGCYMPYYWLQAPFWLVAATALLRLSERF